MVIATPREAEAGSLPETAADGQFIELGREAPLQLDCGKALGPFSLACQTDGRQPPGHRQGRLLKRYGWHAGAGVGAPLP